MTSFMPLRSYNKIVKGLEKQGARIKPVKSGWRILFADGSTSCLHTSGSENRGLLNFRADVRRAGLDWPL